MKKIAIVVQRCHASITGGSESLAWQYANLLKEEFNVEIITTTATDYVTWNNVLSEGLEQIEGIKIRRFSVSISRSSYWHNLHQKLLDCFEEKQNHLNINGNKYIPWSMALQEEFIRHQGPYSKDLNLFLKYNWHDYSLIIFITYLYPTTYFGIEQIPESRFILVPTLHDEPPAYLSAYKYMAQKAKNIIWLTDAEKKLSTTLWGKLSGDVISMTIDIQLYSPAKIEEPYILYSGRIDESKGCKQLFDFFIRFKQENSSNLRLILTGKSVLEIPSHSDIEFRGFVSSEEKFKLMAGASVFVMPSALESFSIVTLEAMAQKTPVLVNGSCPVLVDHVNLSNGGKIFNDYDSFSHNLKDLLSDTKASEHMGNSGRNYVLSNYSRVSVRKKLIDLINCM
ncbi:MAG: glycosyltransferase [Dolichospermum sp. WA123]|nr:glycosyltransferase [Dolichospermum sp. WA123]